MARTMVEVKYSNFEEIQNKIYNLLQMNGYKNISENNENVWKCGVGFLTAIKYIKIEFAQNNTLIISGWIRPILGNEQDLEGVIGCIPKQQIKTLISQIQSYCNNDNMVVCGYCNYRNNSESKFCRECGKELNVKVYCSTNYSQKKCTNCGTDISHGKAFCRVCGTRVDS